MSTASEILGRIEDDTVFKGFLEAGFDPAAFASKIVKADVGNATGSTAPVLLQEEGAVLSSGGGPAALDQRLASASAESVSSQAEITLDSMSAHISRVDAAIRTHILDNEEDFLGSVGGVSELSRRTEEFRSGVRDLRRSFTRLRREVSEPHEAVRLRTQQLKNLHAATRLLKRVLRFLAALRRLRAQEEILGLSPGGGASGGAGRGAADLRELAKAAQSLQELEGNLADPEVAELDIVSRERPYVEACGAAVRRMSADHLARGMKALNQTDVGGALQVFFNIGCLPERVKACVIHLADEADAAASSAFQPNALAEATSSGVSSTITGSSASASTASNTAASSSAALGSASATDVTSPPPSGGGRASSAREAEAAAARRRAARMRAHAGKLAASLYTTSMEAWGLQRVLVKKRDPTTRALLDAAVRADRAAGLDSGAYRAFWDALCRAVRGAVERALKAEGINVAAVGSVVGGGGGNSGGGVALVAMYPSLRKAFLHLMTRLEQGTESSRRVDAGAGGAVLGGLTAPVSAATAAAVRQGAPVTGARGGVLGGSQWLSLALDDDDDYGDDDLSSGVELGQRDRPEVGAGLRGGVGDMRRVSGLRLRGTGGDGTAGAMENRKEGGDGARLQEALGPLRDLFLARSLERLTTPVEQMFPQFRGYMAAVPSKHDLASFVRTIHAELALSVPSGSGAVSRQAAGGGVVSEAEAGGGGGSGGGSGTEADLSLAPLLLRGIVTAVKLLCTKVEVMHRAEAAYTFGGVSVGPGVGADDGIIGGTGDVSSVTAAASGPAPIEAWAPTVEQEHNLQLLELVVKLREAILGIPGLLLPPGAILAGASETGGVVGLEEACREQITEAVKALDETASDVILDPYLSCVARSLEEIIAKMHRENFGFVSDIASSSSSDAHGSGSFFLLELQGALAALQADHFGRISALGAPCAQASLRSLAARLLRSYVTHCALLRPLSEGGKARVAQDMATLEIALSPLARVSELGSVYQESKAFRTLLFVDDDDGEERDARSFVTEACMAHLRPSSVLHYLFSRAPDELSSPHVSRGMSEQAYVSWLLGGGAAAEAKAREETTGAETAAGGGRRPKYGGVRTPAGRSILSPDTTYMAEAGAWAVVQGCLDAYHQRRGAIGGVSRGGRFGATAAELPRVIGLLSEAGPALLSGYDARVRAASA